MLFSTRAGFVSTLLVCLIGCAAHDDKSKKTKGVIPPTPVTIAIAQSRDVPVQMRQIGSVEPVSVIAVKAQIGGELTKVLFREGDDIKKGQELFEIDPRPYQQAVDQAQAAIGKDEALVAQAQANLSRDRARPPMRKSRPSVTPPCERWAVSKDQNSTYQTTFNSG